MTLQGIVLRKLFRHLMAGLPVVERYKIIDRIRIHDQLIVVKDRNPGFRRRIKSIRKAIWVCRRYHHGDRMLHRLIDDLAGLKLSIPVRKQNSGFVSCLPKSVLHFFGIGSPPFVASFSRKKYGDSVGLFGFGLRLLLFRFARISRLPVSFFFSFFALGSCLGSLVLYAACRYKRQEYGYSQQNYSQSSLHLLHSSGVSVQYLHRYAQKSIQIAFSDGFLPDASRFWTGSAAGASPCTEQIYYL